MQGPKWKKAKMQGLKVHLRLSFMHHDCIPILIHRDRSGNNILLNSEPEEEAFGSNFGKARLLDPNFFNQTLVAGTCDYIAPGELFFLY